MTGEDFFIWIRRNPLKSPGSTKGIQGNPSLWGESSTRATRPNLMAQLRRSIAQVKGKHQLGALPLEAACTPSSDLRSTNIYYCDDSDPK